jgi:putative ABC transport system permease protein
VKGFALVLRALVLGPARRRPARVALPVLGVAIGVAAVASIHHANRSVTESFRDAASTVSGRSDFVVKGPAGVPLGDLARLSFLWEKASFAPAVTGSAIVAGEGEPGGDVVEILGVDWGGDAAVRDVRLIAPAGSGSRAELAARGSVLVPAPFAARHGLAPGSLLDLTAGGVPRRVRVGGILELSGVARASGGDLLLMDIFTAQDLLGKSGVVDRVDIVLDPGVSKEAMRSEIARRLPPGLTVEPPTRAAATAERMVRAFRFNLNALGSLTLLVGMFLVANTVSMAVLRRRPEIATLRALGTSRSAIFAAFLCEGAVVGLAGTILGEVLGLFASRSALRAVGGTVSTIYAPTARIEAIDPAGPAALAAIVGLSATLLATLLPAAEAMRVAPSPALRAGAIEGVSRKRLRPRAMLAGLALLLAALASRAGPIDGFPLFGFVAVVLVVAALALAAPLFVRAGAALPGRLLGRALGAAGRLGAGFFGGALAKNGIAVTALAMALGMTLAMIATVASIRQTVRVWVESTLRSDLWIKADAGGRSGFVGDLPPDIIRFIEGIDGVDAVDPFRARDAADPEGRPFTLASGDFRILARAGGLPFVDGRDPRPIAASARARGEVLVSEPFARRFSASDGSVVTLPTPSGRRPFRVAGVYRDYSNDRGTVVLDRELYLSIYRDPRVTSLAVLARPGVEPAELRRRILAAAAGRYALTITTNRELRREVLVIFDKTFAVTRALEAIAVTVAVLGIANALMASAIERRRAFGLLRAVGASGEQIRRATFVEALLTGLTGTLAAAVAGAAFAWLLLTVINPQSFGWTVALAVPGKTLLGASALVLLASLLAGIGPGRVAASVDPAAALAEE